MGWTGSLYAMYSVKKGMELIDGGAGLETLNTVDGVRERMVHRHAVAPPETCGQKA